MTREEREQFEQDRHGNVNRKLDQFRARAGNVGNDDETGITQIDSAETGTSQILYSIPTHVDEAIVTRIYAFDSNPSGGDTFFLEELTLDGAGNITSSQRRSVPIQVNSNATRTEPYEGAPFTQAIGVTSNFEGHVAVGLIEDHDQSSEPDVEQ